MRDKKRTYESEITQADPPAVRPARPGAKQGKLPIASDPEKQGSQFSRELILRLIDWIKQI